MTKPAEPGESAAREILRARARALARPPETGQAAGDWLELLEFSVAHERYAVETRHVTEVVPLRDLTPLPCTPAFIAGIVNVRGIIYPVIDIKKFFDLPERGLSDLLRVILLEGQGLALGLLADAIGGVRAIRADSLQTSIQTFSGIFTEYLKGVTAERTVVLDLDRMLADPKLVVDEEVQP